MAGRHTQKSKAHDGVWAAADAFVSRVGREADVVAWRRVSALRARFAPLPPRRILEIVKDLGLAAETPSANNNILTEAVQLVQICEPKRSLATELVSAAALLSVARAHEDLVERAAEAADAALRRQPKGPEPMSDATQRHVTAFDEAGLDEVKFKRAVDGLFADRLLSAADRRDVAQLVTEVQPRRLSSDDARRAALMQWLYAQIREASRAEDRMLASSRF